MSTAIRQQEHTRNQPSVTRETNRRASAFQSKRLERRYWILLILFLSGGVFSTIGLLLYNNPVPVDSPSFWPVVERRITAVITEDTHPLEAAAAAVRATIHGDDTTRDHALARIRALLDMLDGLRRAPNPLLGDAIQDDTVHLSLVLAAATAPLAASSGFRFPAIAQIARYNQHLLRGAAAVTGAAH